ncbi:PIN domain-containing protein [Desulfofundulus thermobenzoicus]|uniref:PIN domain-containing protein n=1 Tax=Desulfofundulus thermobenzoicus TaxID=29376 RepID=A0A6N7IQS7_9FIRM|nr:PIN domain-containing protein [Desulfofundulus thermobenzoicus]MQL52370.1 PIN domain-containing protein [Desulfofundulus thermobenzoicus]
MSTGQIKVFLDSSVIIAALASMSGGSHEVLALAELGIIVPCISEDVVGQVLRNVQKKLPGCVDSYYTLFKVLPFKIVDPTDEDLEYARSLINEKDAPIPAAAISGKVDWLLSLDKHFLSGDWKGKVNFAIGTPGDFLQELVSFLKGDG